MRFITVERCPDPMKTKPNEEYEVASASENATGLAGYEQSLRLVANRPPGWQAIDTAHVLLVAGLVASHKPQTVLELGIGSAYLSKVMLSTLEANGSGSLISVDNFFDWKSSKPSHIQELEKESPSWQVVVEDETVFVRNALDVEFDLIVSDGDHTRGYQNAVDVFRICRPAGYMVFHDTRSELFRLLARLPARARSLGYSTFHFDKRSRDDEMTDRGLLIVCKDRQARFTMDWATRCYLAARSVLPKWLVSKLRVAAPDTVPRGGAKHPMGCSSEKNIDRGD